MSYKKSTDTQKSAVVTPTEDDSVSYKKSTDTHTHTNSAVITPTDDDGVSYLPRDPQREV